MSRQTPPFEAADFKPSLQETIHRTNYASRAESREQNTFHARSLTA